MKVCTYARLSRDPDGTQTATARQEADCRALAQRSGWEVVEVYEDSDLSGFKRGVVRPDYERMLVDLQAGRFSAIVVWKLDRLSRQPGQFESVVEACERVGARVVSVHEGADMTSPAGLAMMRIGLAFANLESQTISLRVRRAKAELADAGIPNGGGLRPFGHTKNRRQLVAGEADLVREAAQRVLAGHSLTEIARDWGRREIRTTRGNDFQVTTLKRLLMSPRITGDRVHGDRAIRSDVIPPIVDRATFERVREILGDPGRRVGRERRLRALSGLVYCGRCQQRMGVKNRKTGSALYRCAKQPGYRNCGRMVVAAEPLEELVGAMLSDVLDTDAMASALRSGVKDDGVDPAITELQGLLHRRDVLANDHYVDAVITRDQFLSANTRLAQRISELEAAVARRHQRLVHTDLSAGETIARAWMERPAGWRRELARAHLERIVIQPAAGRTFRFDPARIWPEWRA